MKQLLLFLAVVLSTACTTSQKKTVNAPTVKQEEKAIVQQITIRIEGMTCTGCEQTIQANLLKIDEINEAKASHTEGKATLSLSTDIVDTLAIQNAICESGYTFKGFAEIASDSLHM